MPEVEVAETRKALVETFRVAIREKAEGFVTQVPGGEWDGVPVITEKDLIGVLDETFRDRLPAPSERHAEVVTPAEIRVSAVCPLCGIPATVLLTIDPYLNVDKAGRTIHIKTKAKAAHHRCDQLPLPEAEERAREDAPVEGQESFSLGDIVGETCPFPGCIAPADHEGDHVPSSGQAEELGEDVGPDVEEPAEEPPPKPKRGRPRKSPEPKAEDDRDSDLLPGGPEV